MLSMIYAYNGVTTELLYRRFFPATNGGVRACHARIHKLIAGQYLRGTRLPSLTGDGRGKTLLTLGVAARPVLAQVLGVSHGQLDRESRADTPLFVRHHEEIGAFRLSVELGGERSGDYQVSEWVTDRELKREPLVVANPKHPGRTVSIIPDGAFTLTLADQAAQAFYLELDMGTIAPKRIRVKLACYLLYSPLPILFVVPDRRRAEAIVRWTCEEAHRYGADPTIIWVAEQHAVNEQSVFHQPVWRIAGGPTEVALNDLAYQPMTTINSTARAPAAVQGALFS